MKKLLFVFLLGIGFAFISCDNADDNVKLIDENELNITDYSCRRYCSALALIFDHYVFCSRFAIFLFLFVFHCLTFFNTPARCYCGLADAGLDILFRCTVSTISGIWRENL